MNAPAVHHDAAPTAATHRLHFPELDREIETREDETIYQSARRHGLRIVGACGGRGNCGSCIVKIRQGEVERVHEERGVSEAATKRKKWIRSCQISARSDCVVEVAPRSLAGVVRTETDRGEKEFLPLSPAVVGIDICVPMATLSDNIADADRVMRACGQADLGVDVEAAAQLSLALRNDERDSHWSLKVWRRGAEIIGAGASGRRTLGLAVDLGTTNAAAFLVDLESGERLASLGIENPQVGWGADLVSRLNHAIKSPAAARELRDAAVEAINALAHDLCRSVGHAATEIMDVAVCGNTAMHHLLLGLPVRQLGRAPFVASARAAFDLKARELGLKVAPGAWVHVAPNVGGFVGGDHVTALLATESEWAGIDTCLVMDIGTNTEITVMHRGRFFSSSAPSGPALEGGHISCGMRAAIGAIERVGIRDDRIVVETISNKKAIGLCGSGVLDALSVLHRGGLVNDQGTLARHHPDIVPYRGGRAVRLADDVHFTQSDVRAVQLAKAAIRTATDLLLEQAGVQEADLERFIIAGSFGAYIDVESGIETGLFPRLSLSRFRQVGNAAGVGVRRMLASCDARRRAADLAATCQYVELSSRSDFQKIFLRNIGFHKYPN